jgi:hypothetical protein
VHCLPTPPPSIHLVEYAWSAAATAHSPLGTEHTHIIPVNAPPPLWWQPSYHHKMPQSPACLDNSTKLRAWSLKKGFLCLYLLVFLFLCIWCGHSCQLYISAFYAVESSA